MSARNRHLLAAILIAVPLLAAPPVGAAVEEYRGETYYFYHGRDYGSESLINPLQLIINGGYGIMQIENRHNRPLDVDYGVGWRNLWRNMTHPGTAIGPDGFWGFFRHEVVPVSFNSEGAQYWPNYSQHLIGGGMSYRTMVEWYRRHGYEHEKTWAVGTIAVYHVLNEVVEGAWRERWSGDPVADLYIFDPASVLLFSHEGVCRFFSETLDFQDWSYQPVIDPLQGTLYNNGQNFSLKWKLPWSEHWSLFYHYGTHGEFGFSHTWDGGDCLSFGSGLSADTLVELTDHVDGVELAPSAGLFWDRKGSLMASVLTSRTKDNALRLNVYPGLVEMAGLRPGFYAGTNREGAWQFGISFSWLPVGLGAGPDPGFSGSD